MKFMGIRKNKTSVAVFYDGNYISRVSKYYGSNNIVKYRLNIPVLHKYILDEVSAIANDMLSDIFVASAQFYRNRHSASEAINRKNQLFRDRIIDDILRENNIDGHYMPFSTTTPFQDDAYICSWLSLDLLDEHNVKDFDFVVLIAGDSNYIPIVNKLKSKGVETMVVGWDIVMCGGNSIDIKTDEKLFAAANHIVVVNIALDQSPDKLSKLLSPIASREQEAKQETKQEESQNEPTSEGNNDNDEEIEIGEIMTLKNSYGFIRFPNNNLFFRSQDYIGNFSELTIGETVEFVISQTEDGESTAKKVQKAVSNLQQFDAEDESFMIDDDFIDWEK